MVHPHPAAMHFAAPHPMQGPAAYTAKKVAGAWKEGHDDGGRWTWPGRGVGVTTRMLRGDGAWVKEKHAGQMQMTMPWGSWVMSFG